MGEIVVTNLHSHVMPFIRYATADVVVAEGTDPSGAVTRYMRRIEGRASDVLVDTAGRLQPNRDVVDGLVNETGATEFSLYQTTADRILCMTLHDGGFVGQEAKVAHFLRGMLGERLKVDWKVGSTFRLLKSGKRRYICSPVAHALLAHDRDSGMSLSRAWPQLVAEPA
jgi:phenylacetate-coenzyme A ligase PaaK-like adenylate-forming protein